MRIVNITELIACFQAEEYCTRGGSVWQGQLMKHFNRYLAQYGGFPSTTRKKWANVDAPISELKARHFQEFLSSIDGGTMAVEGKSRYIPTITKFVEWLKERNDITDVQYKEMLDALSEF